MHFKLTNEYFDALKSAIKNKDDKFITEQLEELYPQDIAEIVNELPVEYSHYIYALLDKEVAAEMLMELEDDVREDFLKKISSEDIADHFIENLDSDDAADLIGELSDEKRAEVISHIDDLEQAQDIVELLNYDEDTAGGLMAKEYIFANANWTIATAVKEMKKQIEEEEIEDVYFIYVVDDNHFLKGILSLKKMLISDSKAQIANLYDPDVIAVKASKKAEEVANIMKKYDLVAMPVIDELGRLVGRITIDDVVDVIQEEAEKDYQLMSGISQNIESTDNIFVVTKARLPWLIVALFGGMVGARIIGNYEEQISIYPEMAFFMPLVVAMAGNAGVQSSALVVQGLANNSLSRDNMWLKLLKELSVGVVNGLICSAIIFGFSLIFKYPLPLSMTVSCALLSVITFASIFGTLVPLTLNKFKIDPALATGPFITTSNDIIGFFIYFMIGRLMYGVF